MPRFDTNVQELKYKVLKEVAKAAFSDTLAVHVNEIPKLIIPGPKPTLRCCIYKERAVVGERIRMALGGNPETGNVVEVLPIACDECPLGGYTVTQMCRGCIAHRCQKACRRNAISFDPKTRMAIIDKSRCVNCGLCAKACQYGAIVDFQRPCQVACKAKAISMDENFAAKIDDEKCVRCGACVSQCPFGAIMDKSYITDVIKLLKDAPVSGHKVYAIVAPAFSSQFKTATLGQIVSAIKALGFHSVIETALGADMVSFKEAKELHEKKFLTSSCCPAFVHYVRRQFPALSDHISTTPSPMAELGAYLKHLDPLAHVVFIGPCIAKKDEWHRPEVAPFIDGVLTFEELQALIDARDIDAAKLEESPLDNASYFGRIFARAGGLSEAVAEAAKEQNIGPFKTVAADGLDACRMLLLKAQSPTRDFDFLEGMACPGGCIGGPCCLTHEVRDKSEVDAYGHSAKEKTIAEALTIL